MKYLILFFFICGTLLGQSNLTLYQLPTKTSIGSDDYLMFYDNGLSTTNKITLGNFGTSISSILSLGVDKDYTWTGTHNFTSEVQLPTSLAATLSNGVGYNSGLFSWVESGAVKTGADRAWVLQTLADSGVAVDTNNFALLAGDQTFTGTNNFTSRVGIGSSVNNGAIKMPVYTSTNRPDAVDGSAFYHSTSNKFYVYESGWIPFLDSTGVASLMATGSYLPQSGTVTGLSSTLTWSSGTITPKKLSFGGHDAGRSLIMPMDKNDLVSAEEGSIYFDYNDTDNLKIYDGSTWIHIPNLTNVAEKIENDYIDWSVPVQITDDTLDFSLGSRFYIDETNPYFNVDSLTVPTHGKLYLANSNSVYKSVQILIYDEAAITSIFDNGVGHYVRLPDGVTEISCSDDNGFVTFSIEVADATHRYVAYGQQYADWD